MTYCLGLKLETGLVFASDSRTNAGVDYVTTVSKMHVFDEAPDRQFVILSAGSLATTDELLNHLRRDLSATDGRINLNNCQYLFEVAEYVGELSRQIQARHLPALSESGISGKVTLILGGQIQGDEHGMFLIYPQGNYLSASPQTPYLQIGESKYGKPALDRINDYNMSLNEAARLALVSLDATARSNITVGPPFEVGLFPKDNTKPMHRCKFEANETFLNDLRHSWNDGIRAAFAGLPSFPWQNQATAPAQQMQQQQTQRQPVQQQGSVPVVDPYAD